MNRDEKKTWMMSFILSGAGVLFFMGVAVGAGWENSLLNIPFSIFALAFGVISIVWLFRVTFLAGRRYR